MDNAELKLNQRVVEIYGCIGFDNVVSLLQQGLTMFKNLDTITIDLQNVSQSDSSGLALFSAWVRAARKQNQVIQFKNVPQFMQDILRVCGLDSVLPIL